MLIHIPGNKAPAFRVPRRTAVAVCSEHVFSVDSGLGHTHRMPDRFQPDSMNRLNKDLIPVIQLADVTDAERRQNLIQIGFVVLPFFQTVGIRQTCRKLHTGFFVAVGGIPRSCVITVLIVDELLFVIFLIVLVVIAIRFIGDIGRGIFSEYINDLRHLVSARLVDYAETVGNNIHIVRKRDSISVCTCRCPAASASCGVTVPRERFGRDHQARYKCHKDKNQ